MNKIKLIAAVNIIDDEILELKDQLSYLEAAKKNLQVLIDRPAPSNATPKKEDPKTETGKA